MAASVPSFSEYVIDRIIFSPNTTNLSALVFMSGFERAYETLASGYIVGMGFQQMGFIGPAGHFIDSITQITNGNQLNLYDGGTLASKLIVEFGLFGVAFLLAYFAGFINIFIKIKLLDLNSRETFFMVFILFFFVAYSFAQLVICLFQYFYFLLHYVIY
jgi:hypothetical protein